MKANMLGQTELNFGRTILNFAQTTLLVRNSTELLPLLVGNFAERLRTYKQVGASLAFA